MEKQEVGYYQLRHQSDTVPVEESDREKVDELDFGRLGYIMDRGSGHRRVVWVLVVTMAHSGCCFIWPTYSQKLADVVAGLEAAWEYFGGVPKYLLIDNFPIAVAGPDPSPPPPPLPRGFY